MGNRGVWRLLMAGLLAALVSACSDYRPGEAKIPDGATVTHRAVWIGESYHDTVGTISLYQSKDHPVIVFEPNFSLSGEKDAVVALGRNGYQADTSLGTLLRRNGRQAYAVPEHLQIERFNEVWLWSSRENIPLGLARLVPL